MQQKMDENMDLFESRHFKSSQAPTLLLLIDRRDDPVTPLLSQWTYQAMLHELVGIHNNRVSIVQNKGILHLKSILNFEQDEEKKKKEMVISSQDSFFAQNQYSNWGDLCENIKVYIDKTICI